MNPVVAFAAMVFSIVFMSMFAPMFMHYVLLITGCLFLMSLVRGGGAS